MQIFFTLCQIAEFGTGIIGFLVSVSKQSILIITSVASIVTIFIGFLIAKLDKEGKKHAKKYIIAKTALYLLHDIASKALSDNNISDDEFMHVNKCLEQYESLKESHRQDIADKNIDKKVHEALKKRLLKVEEQVKKDIVT